MEYTVKEMLDCLDKANHLWYEMTLKSTVVVMYVRMDIIEKSQSKVLAFVCGNYNKFIEAIHRLTLEFNLFWGTNKENILFEKLNELSMNKNELEIELDDETTVKFTFTPQKLEDEDINLLDYMCSLKNFQIRQWIDDAERLKVEDRI